MSKKIPVVAIVGRTNVGKSTLFNTLLGRRSSIVEDHPGVTRDRNYALVKRFNFPFTIVDTGGLVGEEENPLRDAVRAQAETAIKEADLILAILDGLHGEHPLDADVFRILHQSQAPVIWVVNKCESPKVELAAAEFYALGIDDLSFISAAHKSGIKQLVSKIEEKLSLRADPTLVEERPEAVIKVAILGKPNSGKSTLINKLIGEERLVTSSVAGTTRDSIKIPLKRDGVDFVLLDTAGLRKKARVDDGTVERFSNLRALRALAECDVAVLLLDATQGMPTEQDQRVAGLIHERGRGLIIAVNKWDAVEKDHKTVKDYERMVRANLKFGTYAPILFISALSGRRCPSVLEVAKQVYDAGQERVQTSELNKVLERAFKKKPPPNYRGEPIKIFFATQVGIAPPEFVVFVSHPAKLNFSYKRYLKNILRDIFPFPGYDIKINYRKRTEKADRAQRQAAV